MARKYYIIGITDDSELEPTSAVLKIIAENKVFSGGLRHHHLVEKFLPSGATWIDITVPLDSVFDAYKEHQEIVVFASGDPLFFGFAGTVQRRDPEAIIEVFPTFNSLQLLAHRSLLPYEGMRTLSLTGRPWKRFEQALIEGEPLLGVLTDRNKTPNAIAQRMLDYGYNNYRMIVGENLGNAGERVAEYSIEEVAQRSFSMPNCLILKLTHPRHRPLGIPESDFALLDAKGRTIWCWSDDMSFTQALQTYTLAPGASEEFTAEIDSKTYRTLKEKAVLVVAGLTDTDLILSAEVPEVQTGGRRPTLIHGDIIFGRSGRVRW